MLVKHIGVRNNSGTLLLTVFVLTRRRGNEQFTVMAGICAFPLDDGGLWCGSDL